METPDSTAEREIFAAAAALPPEERAAYLDSTCVGRPTLRAGVEAWLGAHEPSDFMQAAEEELRVHPEQAGERIGNYKLLEKIGEGGFGTVWVADQERPVRRRVALKIIKLGMDTKEVIARFGQERQALAMMDHPHIAKVLDAGATEWGRPYFVMELVRGIKITDYCDEVNLPTAERLALFIQVCQAVQHAHQKGIIHRDLKPSNILVTLHDGVPVPKVIDFGVAKATQQQRLTDLTIYTQFEQMIGTPLYMSPEQAEMSGLDIDTRSDIYSLGVLLYELLTGRTPFDPADLMRKGYDEIRHAIREQEPQAPSMFLQTMADATRATVAQHRQSDPAKLTNLVRGDLDWIVMKALEKDRTRRYETANGLAMDIQRHLANEPVVARPPGNVYRFQKLVRRNKLAVVAAGVVAAVLVVGAVVSTWQAVRATRAEQAQTRLREEAENARNDEAQLRIHAEAEEKKAITEAARSAQVAQFMQGMLNGVGPAVARGRDTELLREILDQTAGRLDELGAQPEVEADLRDTLGSVYRELGKFAEATKMHREALSLRKKLHGNEHVIIATTLNHLGQALHSQGKRAEPEAVYREALAIQRKLLGDENQDVALTLNNLGSALRTQGKLLEAESTFREALAMRRRLFGNENVEVAESLNDLSLLLRNQDGRLAESEEVIREALAIKRKVLPENHPSIAGTLAHLARTLELRSKFDEAEAPYLEALALKKKIFDVKHPEIPQMLRAVVTMLTRAKKFEQAEALQRELWELQKKLLGNDHPNVMTELIELASLLSRQGKHADAEPIYREAISLKKKLVGEGDPSVALLLEAFGQALSDGGKLVEAESVYREALEIRNKLPGKDSELITLLNKIADLLAKQGRFAEAELMFREAIAAQKKRVGEVDLSVFTLLDAFGKSLLLNCKHAEAEIILREATAMSRILYDSGESDLPLSLHSLARVLLEQGKFVEAEAVERESLALRREIHTNVSGGVNSTLEIILLYRGKFDEAEVIVREGVALGSPWSHANLARMYRYGLGVTKDPHEAANWYRKAAELGSMNAQLALDHTSILRKGTGSDPVATADGIRKSADNGDPYARFCLGRIYATGEGVNKDPVKATRWFGLAAESGAVWTLNELAWNLATFPDPDGRDGFHAVIFAERIVARTSRQAPHFLETLAAAYAEVGQFDRAIIVQKEVITLVQNQEQKNDCASRLKLFESRTPYRDSESLAERTLVLLGAGESSEAEPPARQCLAIREQQIPDDWRTFNARSLLGASLLGQQKSAEAEPLLLAAYEGMKQREDKIPANGKQNLKQALQRLVQLYETTARPDDAAQWRKKLAEFDQPEPAKKVAAEPP